jgi:hypothetical protein
MILIENDFKYSQKLRLGNEMKGVTVVLLIGKS